MSVNGNRGDFRGKILVIGGGISGITAAIEAAQAGCEVVLVEKLPYLGGRVAQMNQYFPKLCPPSCGLEINFRQFRSNPRLRAITMAKVTKVAGEAGNYHVTIEQRPRGVNAKCTACGECVEACPETRLDTYNCDMGTTKAIYLTFEMAHPLQYVIDADACPGAECGKCVPACAYDAIDLTMEAQTIELDCQAVIWATGWDPYDANQLEPLGYGTLPDVITNLQMERLASKDGPTQGKILRPSDHAEPASVVFVQCAGSRDENHLKHCSGICCMGSLKQAKYVREQYPDAEIYIYYIDLRAPGRLEDFLATVEDDEKVHFIKGKVANITDAGDGKVQVEAEDALSGTLTRRATDLVVLATGLVPAESNVQLELNRDEHGFLTAEQPQPGLLAAGCAKRPVDVAASVRDATGTALKALQNCVD